MAIDTFPPQNVSAQTPLLGYAVTTTQQSGISAEVDLIGLNVTVTVPAGRTLRITGAVRANGSAADSGLAMYLYDIVGGTTTQLQSNPSYNPYAASNQQNLLQTIFSPSAGTHTFKLTGQVSGSSGTVSTSSQVGNPSWLMVEDVTGSRLPVLPQSVPVGILAQGSLTSNGVAGASGTFPVTLNVTVPAGRTLKVHWETYFNNSGGTSLVARTFATMDGTQVGQADIRILDSTSTERISGEVIVSPSAGAHAFTFTWDRVGTTNTQYVAGVGYPSTFYVEDVSPTPAPASTAPSSLLAQAQVTTTQTIGATAAETDVTGLAVTFTVPAGRTLKVTGHSGFQAGVAGDRIVGYIKEGGTYLGRYGQEDAQQNGGYMIFDGVTVVSPSAGTHTYKLTAQRYGGTGSLATDNAADRPGAIYVEDITGAGVPLSLPPGGRNAISVKRSFSNQTLTAGAWTQVVFNDVGYDEASAYNAATGVYTVPEAGLYEIRAGVRVAGGGGPALSVIGLWRNGASYRRGDDRLTASTDRIVLVAEDKFAVGETLAIQVYTGLTSPLIDYISNTGEFNVLTIRRVGPS
jgi:hypothetical protein